MSVALKRPPMPAARKTYHYVTISAPGFDELTVCVSALGGGDSIELLDVENVCCGTEILDPDKIYVRKPAILCKGDASDFLSLRDWAAAEIRDRKLDDIHAERRHTD